MSAYKYKALIIGCGNIGALYDFDFAQEILTYARAFSLNPEIEFEIYDEDLFLAKKVSEKYNVSALSDISSLDFKSYDLIVVSSPTGSHFEYLSKIIRFNPKLIICEKPVADDINQLQTMIDLYRSSKTKIFVNYFRNFQPGIVNFKSKFTKWLDNDICENIILTYQRGFHNNASHGINLLEFLFDQKINFSSSIVSDVTFDEFKNDPTINLNVNWGGKNLQIIGLKNAKFSHFEIDFFCQRSRVRLINGCNAVEWYEASELVKSSYPSLELVENNLELIDNRMRYVCEYALKLILEEHLEDNFLSSVDLSRRILEMEKRYE